MQLSQVKAFVLIAKHNSLAKAAHELKISPPAVSKQLANLEIELGICLIERTTRSLTLTDAGECFLEQSERILEEVETSIALASKLKAPPKGSLTILTAPFFGKDHIFPHLNEFSELYPDLRLDIELSERTSDLKTEGIDVLIGSCLKIHGEIVQKPMLKTQYILISSPAYLKKHGTPKVPKDLMDLHYITHRGRSPDNKLVFSNKEKLHLRPFLKLNSTVSIAQLVEEGLGFAMLHEFVVKDQLEKGTIVRILDDYMYTDCTIYLAYPKKKFISRATRCFIDFFVGKLPGTDTTCI